MRRNLSRPVVLHNGLVVAGFSDSCVTRPRVISDGAVAWEGERVVAVGPADQVLERYPEARRLDARGGTVLPGLINLHHHFYSALARGLDPGVTMSNFAEVLDRLWWRLDRALDLETVRISAELSVADCIRWGCTTVFDHHASPSCIDGSLDQIAEAAQDAGLSAVLCYEVTDRNGHAQAMVGLQENLRFIDNRRHDSRIRGIVGLHASFTLRDETMSEVVARRPTGVGCHIHLAEDPVDVEASLAAFGVRPVERLVQYGVLDEHCLLAHGIHLQTEEYAEIGGRGAALIHNPESNANNGVGYLDVGMASNQGCIVGLGTDGMSSAVLGSLRAAFLIRRDRTEDPGAGFDVLPDLLHNNAIVARRFLGEPLLGELAPGAPADIVVVDSNPPTAVHPDNLFGHLVYGVSQSPVRHTIARGNVLFEDHSFVTVDAERLAARARTASPALWSRFAALKWGTRYLGE